MLFAVNWVYKVLGKTSFYPMDDSKACADESTKMLKDDEHAIILGKTKPPNDKDISKDCHIQLAPSDENKLKRLQLKFDSFFINDCDIQLQINQAPSEEPHNVEEMASLSCTSKMPRDLYTDEGHLVTLKLQREEKTKYDYNFRINVTSSEGPPPESGLSSPVMIGLCAGGGVVLLIILLLLIRYLCNRSRSEGTEPASNPAPTAVTYSPVQPAVNTPNVEDPNSNKPPLIGFNARVGPPTPEHHALLGNGLGPNPVIPGAPPEEDLDGEVSTLNRLQPDENNRNRENIPERDHSFRAARGNSPPPSYDDAVGLSLEPTEHEAPLRQHSNSPVDRDNRVTV